MCEWEVTRDISPKRGTLEKIKKSMERDLYGSQKTIWKKIQRRKTDMDVTKKHSATHFTKLCGINEEETSVERRISDENNYTEQSIEENKEIKML